MLGAVVLTLAVFVLVVLHECAHALTARRFGIHTRDITLLPMLALSGDLAQLRELNEAGTTTTTSAAAALAQLFAVNVSLALFNLLPAFPLDGGRALRALLAMRGGDYVKATVTAARVGRAFALLFGLVGLFVIRSPMLVIISLFIWLSAASEATAAQTAAALADVPLASLLITDVRTVAPHEPLSRAAELTIQGYQQDFPVIDDGTLVGMLGRRCRRTPDRVARGGSAGLPAVRPRSARSSREPNGC